MSQDEISVSGQNLSKVFRSAGGPVKALDDVFIQIRRNEFFTLLGPSGCGKTTLLRIIAGFEYPDAGDITLEGHPIKDDPPHKRPVNTVFQNYALFPHMTVSQNIGFGLEMLGRDKSDISSTVAKILALVKMEDLAGRQIDQLSGGQQQRVALARALAPSPRVLLLDEPLSALDLKLRKEMQIELKRLQNETGITFIFVTHDQEEALTMSDRVAVMKDGKILQVGTPEEIYDRPASMFVANFIGECNFIPVSVGTTSELRQKTAIFLPSGKSAEIPSERLKGVIGNPVILLRPERVQLNAKIDESPISGVLKQIVYFGTDTQYHVEVKNGTSSPLTLLVRKQNTASGSFKEFKEGQTVGFDFELDDLQIIDGQQHTHELSTA